ncbi:hypothetical protein ILUMI_06841 [Ignelater luminosus]|uniref:Uncharacterized protein n=1 Tax=Ignelater luminosus TaxID=2038154 RepID=A0A8K0D8H6_IGNLU|nr:hypothetical protein ILUMI_06841 [Ignelater luminosus]
MTQRDRDEYNTKRREVKQAVKKANRESWRRFGEEINKKHKVADQEMPPRYGWNRGNEIPGADQDYQRKAYRTAQWNPQTRHSHNDEEGKEKPPHYTSLDSIKKKEEAATELNNKLYTVNENMLETEHVEEKWNYVKSELLNVGKKHLKPGEWMKGSILELMKKMRKYKAKDGNRYKQIHSAVRRRIRDAKEEWMKSRCEEIEKLQKLHDSFNIHKNFKETTG